jgi:hypothetical protein
MLSKNFQLFAIAILMLGGCASVPDSAPSYARAPTPNADLSNVYIYRIGASPTKRTPTIYIDEREVFDPPERSYTVVALAPGKHSIGTKWAVDTGAPNLSFVIDVVRGESYYMKLSGDFKRSGGYWNTTSRANKIDESVAERELLNCCRYIPNKY